MTPLDLHFKLSSKQYTITLEDKEYIKCVSYASAIGSLMYAIVCTHSYISQAISVVSRFMMNHRNTHLE